MTTARDVPARAARPSNLRTETCQEGRTIRTSRTLPAALALTLLAGCASTAEPETTPEEATPVGTGEPPEVEDPAGADGAADDEVDDTEDHERPEDEEPDAIPVDEDYDEVLPPGEYTFELPEGEIVTVNLEEETRTRGIALDEGDIAPGVYFERGEALAAIYNFNEVATADAVGEVTFSDVPDDLRDWFASDPGANTGAGYVFWDDVEVDGYETMTVFAQTNRDWPHEDQHRSLLAYFAGDDGRMWMGTHANRIGSVYIFLREDEDDDWFAASVMQPDSDLLAELLRIQPDVIDLTER